MTLHSIPETSQAGSNRVNDIDNNNAKTFQKTKGKTKSHRSYRSYFKWKWSSARINKKYRVTKISQFDSKGKIIAKLENLTIDSVLAMQDDDLRVSPFNSRSNSPTASDNSSPWETISEIDDDIR